MGFFSSLANSITGGWANVALSFGPATRGEPLEVSIVVAVKSSDILVNEVYLNVECREIVSVPNYQLRDPKIQTRCVR